jgi:magnesium chelatase subunit D
VDGLPQSTTERSGSWDRAVAAAVCLAVDPAGLGGASLRGSAGPAQDGWLERLRALLDPAMPVKRIPAGIGDDRLLGGLDVAASLSEGRAVFRQGVLADCDQGIAVIAMAERLEPGTAAKIASTLDTAEVTAARDGRVLRQPARIAVVALDESADADESPPRALLDRLAFHVDLTGVRTVDLDAPLPWSREDVDAARGRLARVECPDDVLDALCGTAFAFGIESPRATLAALKVARIAAALAAREVVVTDDARLAAALVLGPRATRRPAPPPDDSLPPDEGEDPGEGDDPPEDPSQDPGNPPPDAGTPPPPPPLPPAGSGEALEPASKGPDETEVLQERIQEAALAALPSGLLAVNDGMASGRGRSAGRAGALRLSQRRGRPVGSRPGKPGGGLRLALVDTLRAAAPWQRLRREAGAPPGRIRLLPSDLHVQRFRARSESTTVFILDASGSAALHRLAEAKGAIELMLAQCYVRRDQVAVIAFRGRGAEVLLPPTRSLVRARRSLASLPGGGATPLAAGIEAGYMLADSIRREGRTPTLILLTDGRGNVTRDGMVARELAASQALLAARRLCAASIPVLLVDTSPRPQPQAQQLAAAMGARYLPLPHVDATRLAAAAQLMSRDATRPAGR